MDARLYEAALTGNIASLIELLEVDALILERVATRGDCDSPLHTSALLGHVDFTKEILRRMPELAHKSNSQGFSPLHLAAAKGHQEIVKELLKVDSDVCLAGNKDGRTPLHVAAMSGRVEVLSELVRARPAATRALTHRGEIAFHLCVKHDHFEALKLLSEAVDDASVVNMKDSDDNTVLHLATSKKQIQMVDYLICNTKVEINARNVNGSTALDILLESPHDKADKVLKSILEEVGATSAKEMHLISSVNQMAPSHKKRRARKKKKDHGRWLDETKSTLMVVAILIATETFEAGLNPPGSVWQDIMISNETTTERDARTESMNSHIAGEAIMGYLYPNDYIVFMIFNSIGFLTSLLIILLLISGLPIQRKVLMWILTVTMWISVSSMVVTYGCSVYALSSDDIFDQVPWLTVRNAFFAWLVINGLLFIGHLYRLALRWLKKLRHLRKKNRQGRLMKKRNTRLLNKGDKLCLMDKKTADVELRIE